MAIPVNNVVTIKRGSDGRKRSWLPDGSLPVGDVGGTPGGPVIAQASGSLVDGQTMTLTGSFSARRSKPLFYQNFDDGVVGQLHPAFEGNAAGYQVQESPSPFGSRIMRTVAYRTDLLGAHVELPEYTDEIFFEAWHRSKLSRYIYPTPEGEDGHQVKLWRAVGGTMGQSAQDITPHLGFNYLNDGVNCYASPKTGVGDGNYGGKPVPEMGTGVWSEWIRFTGYSRMHPTEGERYALTSRPDVFSNGNKGFNSPVSGSIYPGAFKGEKFSNWAENWSYEPHGFKRLYLPYFHRSTQETEIEVAHIYINDSPERVVLGDAPTWDTVKESKRITAETLLRNSTELTFRVRLGPLSTGPVYAYAVNEDGKYNANGYLLRG